MFKDYYDILGVLPSSSGREIRTAYKKLALQFHPDRTIASTQLGVAQHVQDEHRDLLVGTTNQSLALEQDILFGGTHSLAKGEATQFTEVQEAYEVLSDVARRYLYDLSYRELLEQRKALSEQLEQQRSAYLARQQAREMQATAEREQARERERQRLLDQQARLDAANAALQNASMAFSMLQPTGRDQHEAREPGAAETSAGAAVTDAATPESQSTVHDGTTAGALPSRRNGAAKQRVPTPPPKDHRSSTDPSAAHTRADTTTSGDGATSARATRARAEPAAAPAEPDEAYYRQRSIQRTMEVFFSKELEEARSSALFR